MSIEMQTNVNASLLHVHLLKIYLTLIVLNGALVSILKFFGMLIPFSLISLTMLAFIPLGIVSAVRLSASGLKWSIIAFLIFFVSFFLIFKLLLFPTELTSRAVALTLVYVLPLLNIFLSIGLSRGQTLQLVNLLIFLGAISLTIGYVQYFFYESMSNAFVELPRIDSDSITNDYIREIEDFIVFRPNGLIGNPITYGFFLLIVLNLTSYAYFSGGGRANLLILVACSVMILILASRANISAMFLQMLIFFVMAIGIFKIFSRLIFAGACVSVLVFLVSDSFPFLNYLLERFTNADDFAAASTEAHLEDYMLALRYISDNPLFGVPIGAYTDKEQIITDGAWFTLALNFGIPLFLLIMVIWIFSLTQMAQFARRNGEFAGLLFPFFLIITFTNFLNSAMLAKSMYILVWFLIGLALNLHRLDAISRGEMSNYKK